MYPLKFENLYYEKIWGGRNFERFRDNLPEGNIGESWDIACHLNGTSVVLNGDCKGISLNDLIKLQGEKLIGTKVCEGKFPLLIKLIDANDKLSIQVHPNDEYLKIEGELGKTEVWYVLEANEESKLILGTKGICTKEEMKAAIESGQLEEYTNEIPAKKGQVFFVKSGLIHAIGKGIVIAEIQQNSDTTYRVYDYNRGRELNVKKALDVIDLNLKGEESKGLTATKEGYSKTYLCLCKEFSLELYDIQTIAKEKSDKERFFIFTCVDGEGEIIYSNSIGNSINIKRGDSILIPASLGEYTLNGKMKLLKSYVPDMKKVEEQILSEVKK